MIVCRDIFYLYCGYYKSVEFDFMVPGHIKFKCYGSFGKTTVDCVNHFIEIVKRLSTVGLNSILLEASSTVKM